MLPATSKRSCHNTFTTCKPASQYFRIASHETFRFDGVDFGHSKIGVFISMNISDDQAYADTRFSWFERQVEPETEMSPPLTVGDIEAEFFIAK
jgi:hypothetical protein